jgi:uncharacterized protein (TIGR02147 family)
MQHSADILMAKFYERRMRNPGYTLRAFARDLKVSSGALSEVLSHKRPLSRRKALEFADRLFGNPSERSAFLATVPDRRSGASVEDAASDERTLSQDEFQIVADWQHFAILNLVETDDFVSTYNHVSRRLGISGTLARASVQRLIRAGLLKIEDGRWTRTHGNLTTTFDQASAALRHSHRQTLEQAIDAIDGCDLMRRELISCTLAFDPEDMARAKSLIRKFAVGFKKALPRCKKTEVYNLNIQLVPVTK